MDNGSGGSFTEFRCFSHSWISLVDANVDTEVLKYKYVESKQSVRAAPCPKRGTKKRKPSYDREGLPPPPGEPDNLLFKSMS